MGEVITAFGGLVGLCGYDGADWEKVLIDASKRLEIAIASSVLPDDAATAAKQLADGHNVTVDNASLPVTSGSDKIFAFESIVSQSISDPDLSTGSNDLNGTAVGSTKVWKITTAAIRYTGTPPTEIWLLVKNLAEGMYLLHITNVVSDQWYFWNGEVYMEYLDYMVMTMTGATATDDAIMRYAGVQMDAP